MISIPKALPAALAGACILCSALATAQVTKKGTTYLLRVKYSKGQKLKFNSVATYSTKGDAGTAGSGKATSPVEMNVLGVAKGIANVKFAVGPTMIGSEETTPRKEFTSKLDTKNKMVGGGQPGLESLTAINMPEKPVAVGQKWNAKVATEIGMGAPIIMSVTYTFEGLKKVNNKQVAIIAMTYTGKGIADFKGKGQSQLLVSDGTLLSSTYSLKATIKLSPEQSTVADIGFRVNRL